NASTDNVGVTGYKVYIDGANPVSVATTGATISNLDPDTEYDFSVSAYDANNNESAQNQSISVTTQTASSSPQLFNLYGVSNIPRVPARQDLFWPQNVGEYDICYWDHDRFAAFSITIDDNTAQDHDWWQQMAATYD